MKSLVSALGLFWVVSSFGKPIEGYSDKVLHQHSDFLKSVVSLIFDGRRLCTGSLIREDLILTAKHCMADQSLTNQASSDIFLSNMDGVNAQLVIANPIILSSSSDLAIIQFKNKLNLGSKPLEVSVERKDPTTIGSVLLAGYGKVSPVSSPAGALKAGTNTLVEGSALLKWMMYSLLEVNQEKRYKLKEDAWHLLGARDESFKLSFKAGDRIRISTKTPFETIVPENQATTMAGDSGGPLIAFENGVPKIIGVDSNGNEAFYGSGFTELTIIDPSTKTNTKFILSSVLSGHFESNREVFMGTLDKAGYLVVPTDLQSPILAKKDFSIEYKMIRYKSSEYENTTTGLNAAFITEALKLPIDDEQ